MASCYDAVAALNDEDAIALTDAYDRNVALGMADNDAMNAAIDEVKDILQAQLPVQEDVEKAPEIDQSQLFTSPEQAMRSYDNYNNTFKSGLFSGNITTNNDILPQLQDKVFDAETTQRFAAALSGIGGEWISPPNTTQQAAINDAMTDLINNGMPAGVMNTFEVLGVHSNDNGNIAAFVPETGNIPNTLYMQDSIVDLAAAGDKPSQQALRNTIAHELGHAVDMGADGNSASWSSKALRLDPWGIKITVDDTKPMGARLSFSRAGGVDAVGPVMREVLNKINTREGVKTGLTKYLMYPLQDLANVVMQDRVLPSDTGGDVTVDWSYRKNNPEKAAARENLIRGELMRIQAEVFAQLHALYYTKSSLMQRQLPKAYKMMQEVHSNVQKASSTDSFSAGVRAALRSSGVFTSYSDPATFGRYAVRDSIATGLERRAANLGVQTGPPGQQIYSQQQAADPYVKERVRQAGPAQATEESRRGVRTNEATRRAAEQLGVSPERLDEILRREYGTSYNAEQVYNTAQILGSKGTELADKVYEVLTKVEDGRATDMDLAQIEDMINEITPLGVQFLGVTAEAGRALQIYNRVQDAKNLAKALTAALESKGGRDALIERMRIIASSKNPVEAVQRATEANQIKFIDKLMEYYRAMLLTGIPTHVVNFVSNGGMQLLNDVDYTFASLIGAVTGSEDAVSLKELKARIAGYVEGTRLGLSAAYEQLKDEDAAMLETFPLNIGKNKIDARHRHAIKGFKGRLVRMPYRLLGAGDAVYKGIAFGKALRGEAQRLIENGDTRSIDELIQNPTEQMVERAQAEADYLTFTEDAGAFTQWIMKGVRQHPTLGILLPFIRTPSNIIKVGLKHSPAAPFFSDVRADLLKGGRARDLALARIATGTSLGAMAIGLAAAGLLTGQPPEDPNERRMWLMEKQANSIKIGDTWVSYSRLEPFGMLLGIAGDMYTLADRMDTDEANELGSLVIASITNNLTNKTYLKGLTEFVSMINDPERYGERWLLKMGATAAVPVFFSYTAKATDDRLRRAETLIDHIKARLPGLRNTLPERLDVFGQPIMEQGAPIYRFISPAYLKTAQNDEVGKEILKYDVSMPQAGKKYQGVELEPEQYNSLVEALGKPTYNVLKRVVNSGMYRSLSPPDKQWLLQKVIDRVRGDARKYWAYAHPAIMQEAAQRKLDRRYTLQ